MKTFLTKMKEKLKIIQIRDHNRIIRRQFCVRRDARSLHPLQLTLPASPKLCVVVMGFTLHNSRATA